MVTRMSDVFTGLLDDAAVFPPGSLPVDQAVAAHAQHLCSPYGDLVGPFVVAASDLDALSAATDGAERASLELVVTVGIDGLAAALRRAGEIPAVALVGIEVALGPSFEPVAVAPAIDQALAGRSLSVAVEVPRDVRRMAVIGALADTPYNAKLRVGGPRADLYPGDAELAEAIATLVGVGVAFKATAGLHHAVRNTDPKTGFEQHGFLNLMLATSAAMQERSFDTVVRTLAERDVTRVVAATRELDPCVREQFRSFGTCSVSEPVEELRALGLLP
jgi:hypothetical protein